MLKVVYFLYRRDGMSTDAFVRYWEETHVPLVRQLPGLRRYRICPVLGSAESVPPGHAAPDADGIAELYYDDVEAFERAKASPEMRAAEADVPRFTRLVTALLVREVPLIDG